MRDHERGPQAGDEQWLGQGASVRSDVYSAGLVLYVLLVGALPHAGLDAEGIARQVTARDAPPVRAARPEVPEALSDLVSRCLSRSPAGRPASARELRAALEDIERVFLPEAAGALPRSDRARLLASLTRLRSQQDAFIADVYQRLFAEAPALRALFPGDLAGQGKKVVHALQLAVDALDAPERLAPMLRDLGLRHAHYGVRAEHFAALKGALLGAILAFDDDPERSSLAAAWERAYAAIEQVMRAGLLEGDETVGGDGARPARLSGAEATARRGASAGGSAPAAPVVQSATGSEPVPEVRYAYNGDVSLAYQIYGEGPVEIIMTGWLSHIELTWQQREVATFLRRLGTLGRVVLYDIRGVGLSDRNIVQCTLEDRLDDLAAVQAAAGLRRPVLYSFGVGNQASLAYAALHPERVGGLVLYSPAPAMKQEPAADGTDVFDAFEALARIEWGRTSGVLNRLAYPSRAHDQALMEWAVFYQRMVISPSCMVTLTRSLRGLDVRALAPLVRAPTLVTHRLEDPVIPIALGRTLAKHLPEARFVELSGGDAVPAFSDQEELFAVMGDFLASLPAEAPALTPLRLVAVLRCEGPPPQVEAFVERGRALAALQPRLHCAELPEGALLLVHDRCGELQRLCSELHLLARGLQVSLRAALCGGLYEGPDSAVVAAARRRVDGVAPGVTHVDEVAGTLLSG